MEHGSPVAEHPEPGGEPARMLLERCRMSKAFGHSKVQASVLQVALGALPESCAKSWLIKFRAPPRPGAVVGSFRGDLEFSRSEQ